MMKSLAATLEESEENSAILRVYSNESLTSLEAEELTSYRGLIFNPNNPCYEPTGKISIYELTGKISIKDAHNAGNKIKLDNNEVLYEVAEAEVVPATHAQTTYCPFQKGFSLKRTRS